MGVGQHLVRLVGGDSAVWESSLQGPLGWECARALRCGAQLAFSVPGRVRAPRDRDRDRDRGARLRGGNRKQARRCRSGRTRSVETDSSLPLERGPSSPHSDRCRLRNFRSSEENEAPMLRTSLCRLCVKGLTTQTLYYLFSLCAHVHLNYFSVEQRNMCPARERMYMRKWEGHELTAGSGQLSQVHRHELSNISIFF